MKSTLPATTIRFFTLTSNLHKVTSFLDVTAVKTKVTSGYMTSYTTYALNTSDFYPVLGEIRIVGPGKHADILIWYARHTHPTGSNLKGKNLLYKEYIPSFKS